ncbi:(2Fe-2S) ferredoxin domain-containing protein [Erysipelotrichaceae bacterium Oil+RF-744-GAM-WT-6]|jgi:NADP-reducing hydrogenase subunit HndB|uniref:(2Fe-2S) ferredoxin domain-containing protein n=1 Tax=Stecheria intestinalis TaxID=2606630 RepID=A0A7X2NQA9_9FIRM|nr:(2Fe-2S) ferredoxin domain-containing protein [Stecheria intestinalis]MCI2153196.1 (2Fe-2S) ferredoxin domain-containing protein [Solobacterium sp.]MCI6746398.1 (2Fe-2S) ferredoxin domain-containing protein [Anaerolactibacter massiliensis]MDY3234620.1 (2Fe-2S) ferredoxin domain-containing protein [Erysipelotrichaceae bacterium]MDY4681822.1 (2Fe-2S) ferredoxin domain-containing protein [Lachnospiraceae bacterium]MDD5880572.1 (2Fe-2S) ferredoxin domain-containing protein [Stecheria intestinal
MKSLEDLKKMREAALKKVEMRDSEKSYRVVVGMATCGIAAGARPVLKRLVEETAEHSYDCVVTQTGCIGMCVYEPIVEVYGKDGEHTTYVHMTPEKAAKVLAEHIGKGHIVEEYTVDAAKKAQEA